MPIPVIQGKPTIEQAKDYISKGIDYVAEVGQNISNAYNTAFKNAYADSKHAAKAGNTTLGDIIGQAYAKVGTYNAPVSSYYTGATTQIQVDLSGYSSILGGIYNQLKEQTKEISESVDINLLKLGAIASETVKTQQETTKTLTDQQEKIANAVNQAAKLFDDLAKQAKADKEAEAKAKAGSQGEPPIKTVCGDIELPLYLHPFKPLFDLICWLNDGLLYVSEQGKAAQVDIKKLENSEYDDLQELWNAIFGSGIEGDIISVINTLIGFLPFFLKVIRTSYAEADAELDMLIKRTVQPNRLDIGTLILALRRDKIDLEDFYDRAKELGWSKKEAFDLLSLNTQYPTLTELLEMYRRGLIPQDELKDRFNDIGIDTEYFTEYEDLAWYVPPVQDIIRFAIRDVFTPDVVSQGGLMQDIPQAYIDKAKLSGLDNDTAKLYWASHWIIPSINQGYEMLQRNVINKQELETLFKAADIAPNWRDKLLAISYNIPTRVDVRRMYEDGVIDDNQLQRYLLDYGYSQDDMQKVFLWYKKRKAEVNKQDTINFRELGSSAILRAYKKGIINKQLAMQKLIELNYTASDGGLMLLLADVELEEKSEIDYTDSIRNRLFKNTEKAYLSKVINADTVKDMLSDIGITNEEIQSFIDIWDLELELSRREALQSQLQKQYIGYELDAITIQDTLVNNGFSAVEAKDYIKSLEPFRELRSKDLTRTDIKKAFSTGYKDVAWVIDQLKGLGYSDSDIDVIVHIEGMVQ